jgi:hypothetical protein
MRHFFYHENTKKSANSTRPIPIDFLCISVYIYTADDDSFWQHFLLLQKRICDGDSCGHRGSQTVFRRPSSAGKGLTYAAWYTIDGQDGHQVPLIF